MTKFYRAEVEQSMRQVYGLFSEKDQRIYAAIEAKKLPYGGVTYVAEVLGCHPSTIHKGLRDLDDPASLPRDRIRRRGGGRKPAVDTIAGLDEAFLAVVADHTAGDPMNEKVVWTDLTPREIAHLLREKKPRDRVFRGQATLEEAPLREAESRQTIGDGNQ